MSLSTKFNFPDTYHHARNVEGVHFHGAWGRYAAKEGEYISRSRFEYDEEEMVEYVIDEIDRAIIENVATFKYLTFEQIFFLMKARGFDVTRKMLDEKIQCMKKMRTVWEYKICNKLRTKPVIYYKIDHKGVPVARDGGVMFHDGIRFLPYRKRQAINMAEPTAEDVKRVLMGNSILISMLKSNAQLLRIGILETFRPEREERIKGDGILRTAVNVKVDEESVLAFEVVRDTEEAYEKLANKVKRYYLLLHEHERDYLERNFHGDSVCPQLIICGESFAHNRKIQQYLMEQNLWREEDPILFTEDRLHTGDSLQIIYGLEDEWQEWYELPVNEMSSFTEQIVA